MTPPITTAHQASVRRLKGVDRNAIPSDVLASDEPIVLKGLVRDWPLVCDARKSDHQILGQLRAMDGGRTVGAYFGEAGMAGRYAYTDDVSRLNFVKQLAPLREVLDRIEAHLNDDRPPAIYVGSATIDTSLPTLRSENDLRFADAGIDPIVSIWLGNRSIIPCHYDAPSNLACSVAGHRRFTLFPPEQVHNLYPGPLDPTPGGQAISMVDFAAPDFERYPKFRRAVAAARVVELEPGDAIFIPSLWWHQVEATGAFNVLINYWWSRSAAFMGTPMNALYHTLLSLRDRPDREKRAWREMFDHYVFGPADAARDHLPSHARGLLDELSDADARQLRSYLLNRLNR